MDSEFDLPVSSWGWRPFTASVKSFLDAVNWFELFILKKRERFYRQHAPAALVTEDTLIEAERVSTLLTQKLKDIPKQQRFGRNILIESLFEHPACIYNTLLLHALVGKFVDGESIVLLNTRLDPAHRVWVALGFRKFIFITEECNSLDRLKAIISAISIFSKTRFSKYDGFPCEIQGKRFGDLMYDDLLRKANLPTYRKKGLLLFAFIYHGCLRYWVYKKIFLRESIGNVVATDNVYCEFGMLYKIGDEAVNRWVGYNCMPFVAQRSRADWKFNSKQRHLRREDLDSLLKKGSTWIEQQYEKLVQKEFSGQYNKGFDDDYILNQRDIVSISDMQKFYGSFMNPTKKNVIVMSHIFVDAVNVAHWSLFADYYTWLMETLKVLAKNENVNVFVKPHPAEEHYDLPIRVADIVRGINRHYGSNICFFDKKVFNEFLFQFGDIFITSTGTVATQAPCFGKPTIVAAWSKVEEARTLIQPRTVKEYEKILQNVESLSGLDQDGIIRAKAAYLFHDRMSICHTYYNARTDVRPDSNRTMEWNLIRKRLEQAGDPLSDPFINAFIKSFVEKGGNLAIDENYLQVGEDGYNN